LSRDFDADQVVVDRKPIKNLAGAHWLKFWQVLELVRLEECLKRKVKNFMERGDF
jgi:hypothetical protein